MTELAVRHCAGTSLRHGHPGEHGTGPGRTEESQAVTASDPARALTERLMEDTLVLAPSPGYTLFWLLQ